MTEEDKYPSESGRRRFVKGVVGGAALSGVGAAGIASINTLTTQTGAGGGQTEAMAIERTGGPAPRGMPQIPVELDDEGYLRGIWPDIQTEVVEGVEVEVARMDLGGETYAGEWFQYCGYEGAAGIQPDFDSDNYFHVTGSPGYDWQHETYDEGDRLHIDHFDDYQEWGNEIGAAGVGKPATCRWRSEGADEVLPVNVIRSTQIEEAAQESEWLEASTEDGFLAYLNVCTHFCCVPGYKRTADSARYDGEDKVYCQCHQSVYDPFNIVRTLFIARPRPQ